MILAEAAEQGSSFATQAFLYVAVAVAVIYFGWQFYKGAKEEGPLNTGWLSGSKKRDDAAEDASPVAPSGIDAGAESASETTVEGETPEDDSADASSGDDDTAK